MKQSIRWHNDIDRLHKHIHACADSGKRLDETWWIDYDDITVTCRECREIKDDEKS